MPALREPTLLYRQKLSDLPLLPRVREGEPSSSLSERELFDLWEGQRFPPAALSSRRGERLSVIYRGRATGGPGPDFRDAVIAAPWGVLLGDVELHVRASDFARHGHALDPAYDRLVLHLVFWDDAGEDTRLASGRRVPVAALAPWAERRSQQLRAWLSLPVRWQEPCRSAIDRLGPPAVAAALDRLGDRRFQEKVQAFAVRFRSEDGEEVLWQALLEALGYGGNRDAFRLLAQRLPWLQLRAALAALPAAQERTAAARRLLQEAAFRPPLLPWQRRGLRPGNGPGRRLEGAAALAGRYALRGLAPAFLRLAAEVAERGPEALIAGLIVPEGGQALPNGGQAFVGRGRALEIAANVLLPFAAAWRPAVAGAAASVYRRLPRPAAYGAVRHLDRALGGAVPIDARRQQGMLYLLRWYCTQGGCGRCPLS